VTTSHEAVVVSRRRDGRLEAAVPAVPGWDGFDKLIEYLESVHDVDLVRRVDGPDARRAWLVSAGTAFEVEYDDSFGSALVVPDAEAEKFVLGVADDLRRRLGGA
jgi:hypothetical protein